MNLIVILDKILNKRKVRGLAVPVVHTAYYQVYKFLFLAELLLIEVLFIELNELD